jgi:hypothetical protein
MDDGNEPKRVSVAFEVFAFRVIIPPYAPVITIKSQDSNHTIRRSTALSLS